MKKLLNKKGFTIVELVIVIAVIAILAAVLIPTFSNVIESANKSADLSEAQNSLKAYSAYTSSKGQSLADGTVFKVKKSNRTYVFYKGSLHEFKEHNIVGDYGVILTIGSDNYKSNKMTAHYLNDSGKEIEFEKSTEGYVNFFYSDTKNVTFEDGSLNCEIYPGRLIYTNSQYVQLNASGAYVSTSTSTQDVSKLIDLKKVVNVNLKQGDEVSQVLLVQVSSPVNEQTNYEIHGYNISTGTFTAEAKITIEKDKTYTSDQVAISDAGVLTAKNGYTGSNDIVITVNIKTI